MKKTRVPRTLKPVELEAELPERIAALVQETIKTHDGEIAFLLDETIAQVCAISLIANKTPRQVLEFLLGNVPELAWPEDALKRLIEGAEHDR